MVWIVSEKLSKERKHSKEKMQHLRVEMSRGLMPFMTYAGVLSQEQTLEISGPTIIH